MKVPEPMRSLPSPKPIPFSGNLDEWLHMLETIAESSTNMIVVTDSERRIKWVNAMYTKVTGWSLAECQGRRPNEFLHGPKTDPQELARLSGFLRQGLSASGFELVNYRKSGEHYVVAMNIEPIRDSAGKVYAYLSIQSDVSERRELEWQTRKLNKRLKEAQRLARLGWIETDRTTGESRWSDEVYRLLGLPPDQTSRGLAELLAFSQADDLDAIGMTCEEAYESGHEISLEFRVTGAHGGRRWVRCRGLPTSEANRYLEPETWSVQDITFYKSRFEEKARHNDELSQQVSERTKKLEASNTALEEFSYALSHDLRTPLRHVASFAELLREELEQGKLDTAAQYAERIVSGARQMQGLIEAMLSFAQLGRASLRVGPLDLGAQIREIATSLEVDSATQCIQWRIADDLPVVQADPILMGEVWVNLLSNALKYAKHRPIAEVEIGWDVSQEGWTVFVRDNGIGFDTLHAGKLFGMFERLHRDKRFEGLGVGLALVRQIVESHGGRIWADSAPDHGATFFVFLPFAIPISSPARTQSNLLPNATGPGH